MTEEERRERLAVFEETLARSRKPGLIRAAQLEFRRVALFTLLATLRQGDPDGLAVEMVEILESDVEAEQAAAVAELDRQADQERREQEREERRKLVVVALAAADALLADGGPSDLHIGDVLGEGGGEAAEKDRRSEP
jgi:hypothetical protein